MKTLFRSALIASFLLIFQAGLFAQTKTVFLPSNPNIQYMGRIDFTNQDKPLFAFPNVTIKAKFEGTSLDMLLKDYNGTDFTDNYFYSIIDGKSPVRIKVTSAKQLYSLAKNLTDGVHTAEVIKITESYCGECQFLGFQTDTLKTLLAQDPLPELKLEFFGNSITCGFGIEGGAQPLSDNSYKAYPAVAARELKAQFHTTSYSGIGVVKSWPPFLMSDVYNRIIAVKAYNPTPGQAIWDFKKYIPDYVIVALGTNDYNLGFNTGAITANSLKTGFRILLNKIRTAYPNAHIICTNSPMVSDAKLGTTINEVVTTFNTNGDSKFHYFSFSYQKGGGWGGHPGVADGQTNGKEIAAYIQSIFTTSKLEMIDKVKEDFTLTPNPAKNSIRIKSALRANRIEISDPSGKIIETAEITLPGEYDIDISQLSKGIYFFSIMGNTESPIVKKISKL